jgi:hypothetical protein
MSGPPPIASPQQLLGMATNGLTLHQTLYVVAVLGVADQLEGGPAAAADLARRLEVDESALYRVLRYLASQGVFAETAPRSFANNDVSRFLRAGVPGSLRPILLFRGSGYFFEPYGKILHSVRTGLPARSAVYGMDGFEYLRQHPEDARVFDDAMTALSAMMAPAVAHGYDFGAWESVTDVGGGNGLLLAEILRAHPRLRGVLADQPDVLARARERGLLGGDLAARSGYAECDFFREIPAGTRAYLMKSVIHDWDDARAREILRHCRRAVPDDGALLLVESRLPEDSTPSLGKVVDIAMLLLTGGRERTVEEYRALLADGGFRLSRVVVAAPEIVIIEAEPG